MYEINNIILKDYSSKKDFRIPNSRLLTSGSSKDDKKLITDDTLLLQSQSVGVTTSKPILPESSNNNTHISDKVDASKLISVNGNGLAGIMVGFCFVIPILILVSCMMNIFVSQIKVEHSLMLGRIET